MMSCATSSWAQNAERPICFTRAEAEGIAQRNADMATLVLQQDSLIAAQQRTIALAWLAVDAHVEESRLHRAEADALRQQLAQVAKERRKQRRSDRVQGFVAGVLGGLLIPRPR
jgi:hypothetical protein